MERDGDRERELREREGGRQGEREIAGFGLVHLWERVNQSV